MTLQLRRQLLANEEGRKRTASCVPVAFIPMIIVLIGNLLLFTGSSARHGCSICRFTLGAIWYSAYPVNIVTMGLLSDQRLSSSYRQDFVQKCMASYEVFN